jgi:tetratricopeptide (TPR) repeat protein
VPLLLCLCWGISAAAQSGTYFQFTDRCTQAYQQLTALKTVPASRLLAAERAADPANLVPVFLESYADFFQLFFNEDPVYYQQAWPRYEQRLAQLAKGPDTDPFTRFAQAVVHLHMAAISIKFDKRWTAGWHFRDAFKLAKANRQRFPQFSPNLMLLGPLQMAASTIPKGMRWLSGIMGISGNMAEGKALLDKFMAATDSWARFFRNEGIFYQCYLQAYLLNEPLPALQFIQQQLLDVKGNHLFAFMAANLHLNNQRSLQTQQIVQNRLTGPDYLDTPIWDFEMAYARLYQLQPDAGYYFHRFLTQFRGKTYLKDAWLKLGYHYLLQGNKAQYRYCLQQVLKRGSTVTEADKRAQKEAKLGREPNLLLLKTRLLTDGGYAREALNLLEGKTTNDFADGTDRLEFTYRLGRIYEELQQTERALRVYENAMRLGANSTEYYAARAALQCGLIMEKAGKCEEAKAYFQRCIDFEGHDFEDALEQKARAGQQRCSR